MSSFRFKNERIKREIVCFEKAKEIVGTSGGEGIEKYIVILDETLIDNPENNKITLNASQLITTGYDLPTLES